MSAVVGKKAAGGMIQARAAAGRPAGDRAVASLKIITWTRGERIRFKTGIGDGLGERGTGRGTQGQTDDKDSRDAHSHKFSDTF